MKNVGNSRAKGRKVFKWITISFVVLYLSEFALSFYMNLAMYDFQYAQDRLARQWQQQRGAVIFFAAIFGTIWGGHLLQQWRRKL